MTKKVLVVAESLHCGGVEKSLIGLLSAMEPQRYEITLALLDPSGPLRGSVPSWIQVDPIRMPTNEWMLIRFGQKRSLLRNIRRRRYLDALRGTFNALRIVATARSAWRRRRAIYEMVAPRVPAYPTKVDVAIDYMGYGLFNTFYVADKVDADLKISWIHSDVGSEEAGLDSLTDYYERFDHFFGVSEGCADQFASKLPNVRSKTSTLLNTISVSTIRGLAVEGEGFQDTYDHLRIVSVGRLVREKAFDRVVDVACHLRDAGYTFRWYVIGDGPLQLMLQRLIDSHGLGRSVILLGHEENPYPYMAQCDIYVQTSTTEGYGLTIAEAQALAKPIVATRTVGAESQIDDGKNGLLADHSTESLYAAVRRLIDSPDLRLRLQDYLESDSVDVAGEVQKLYDLIDRW